MRLKIGNEGTDFDSPNVRAKVEPVIMPEIGRLPSQKTRAKVMPEGNQTEATVPGKVAN